MQGDQFCGGGQIGNRGRDAGPNLVWAIGTHQHERARLPLVRHKPQQVHSRLVAPLRIVKDHYHGCVGRRTGQQPTDRVERS